MLNLKALLVLLGSLYDGEARINQVNPLKTWETISTLEMWNWAADKYKLVNNHRNHD